MSLHIWSPLLEGTGEGRALKLCIFESPGPGTCRPHLGTYLTWAKLKRLMQLPHSNQYRFLLTRAWLGGADFQRHVRRGGVPQASSGHEVQFHLSAEGGSPGILPSVMESQEKREWVCVCWGAVLERRWCKHENLH